MDPEEYDNDNLASVDETKATIANSSYIFESKDNIDFIEEDD